MSCRTRPEGAWQEDPAMIFGSAPGETHGRRAAEALYGGLAEGIITVPEVVMMDWTSWSSPIDAARQTGREDSSKPSPVGLHHHSELCDICHTCGLATVVSP
jgi:hypothetical protein